jgi:hypothetical protein
MGLIFQAKKTLTNPDLRKQYDAWRSAGLAIKFQQWLSLKVFSVVVPKIAFYASIQIQKF